MSMTFNTSNMRSDLPGDVACTIVGVMENNPSMGVQDLINQWSTTQGSDSAPFIVSGQDPTDEWKKVLNDVWTYGVPTVMMLGMLA